MRSFMYERELYYVALSFHIIKRRMSPSNTGLRQVNERHLISINCVSNHDAQKPTDFGPHGVLKWKEQTSLTYMDRSQFLTVWFDILRLVAKRKWHWSSITLCAMFLQAVTGHHHYCSSTSETLHWSAANTPCFSDSNPNLYTDIPCTPKYAYLVTF